MLKSWILWFHGMQRCARCFSLVFLTSVVNSKSKSSCQQLLLRRTDIFVGKSDQKILRKKMDFDWLEKLVLHQNLLFEKSLKKSDFSHFFSSLMCDLFLAWKFKWDKFCHFQTQYHYERQKSGTFKIIFYIWRKLFSKKKYGIFDSVAKIPFCVLEDNFFF